MGMSIIKAERVAVPVTELLDLLLRLSSVSSYVSAFTSPTSSNVKD
jgi:hypothetical protein